MAENIVRLDEDDPRAVEAMINFMYGFAYDSSGSEHGRVSPMLFNIKVYQIADKFDIPKLKEEAHGKFTRVIGKCWEMDDFPTAVEDAYRSTTSTDRGLRDSVVTVSVKHIDDLLANDSFNRVLSETTGFAADIVQRLRSVTKWHLYLGCLENGTFYVTSKFPHSSSLYIQFKQIGSGEALWILHSEITQVMRWLRSFYLFTMSQRLG